MEGAHTGPQRIKGGVPAGWTYGHKTGTGQQLAPRSTGYNDVGIMTAPDGTSYAVAVMIASTTQPIPKRWELMQAVRSEEHTSELQSLMRISYAVFCLTKKIQKTLK